VSGAGSGRQPSPAGDALARALNRAGGSRAIPGNMVRPLTDGPEIFAAVEGLLDSARQWIHFENYIIRDDATGDRFASLLLAAAARGVQVRVLYDALGCRRTGRAYWRRLDAGRVVAVRYNPLNALHPFRSARRNHRKYVAADGIRAVTGGFCFGDEWAGDPAHGVPPWRDTGIEIRGPAVPALEHAFLRTWRDAGGDAPGYEPPGGVEEAGDALVRLIEGVPGRWRLTRAAQLLVASAAERLWITDAYLVAPAIVFSGLVAAARDGVDVRLLVPGRTDIPAIRTLTRVGYRELLDAGARIWEWRGPMIHAKTIVVDDRWFKVGSSNLNPSSLAANYELDLLVEHRAAARHAATAFLHDLTNAVEIVLRHRPVARRLPPAVVPAADAPRLPAASARELSRRAVVTLRQVAGGARRSIAGAVTFAFLGAGALLVTLPRIMAYVLAVVCFGLAGASGRHFLERRRAGD
jgi:cardiolipin synthase